MLINGNTYKKHECFGSIAAILGIAGSIPQIYKTWKTKDVKSFSLVAIIMGTIRAILWGLHGYYMNDSAGRVASLWGIFYSTFLLYAKIFFKSR